MVTKRPCISIAQINGFSGMTYSDSTFIMVARRFQITSAIVLLNITYKAQYGRHYNDKETMRSKYLS